MSIQLITFDLDDTLWDVGPVIHSAENSLRDWLGQHAPRLGGFPVESLAAIRRIRTVHPLAQPSDKIRRRWQRRGRYRCRRGLRRSLSPLTWSRSSP